MRSTSLPKALLGNTECLAFVTKTVYDIQISQELIKLDGVALLIAHPSQCNSINGQNPHIHQNRCNF